MFFENMGVKYIGFIDGYDINVMIEVFNMVKEVEGLVIIYILI